jgi:TRAP-type mannitol/chloroaromatic compound transport system substrate-binding protein
VNAKAWAKLPPDLQAAMQMMPYEVDARWDYMGRAESVDRLQKMLKLGLEQTTLSEGDMKKAREIAVANALEWRSKSDMSKRIIDSIVDYLKKTGVVK